MAGFEHARALVTGGTRGLGRAVALHLARAGARVAVTWAHDEAAASATLDELRALSPESRASRVSVTDVAATTALVKELERDWGGVTGYFADPDGYHWEVAVNPGPIGQVVLP